MSTSGTYSWAQNRDQVVTAALRKLAVLPSGGSPSTNQLNDGVAALNAILKAFHADGMPLWCIVPYNFPTVANTSSYTIGTGLTLNTVAPLKVIQARRAISGSPPVNMNIYDRYDFNILPQLSTITGTPVNLYYQASTIDSGTITIWPVPPDNTTTIYIDYQRPFQDMVNPNDNLDFPNYWTQAVIYTLAWSLSPEYGIPPTDRNILSQEAKFWKEEALSYGSEEGSVTFQPDTTWRK